MNLFSVSILIFLRLHLFSSFYQFGTKNLYKHSFNENEFQTVLKATFSKPKECHPIYVSGVFRHGSRSPSDGSIRKTLKFVNRVKSAFESLGSDNVSYFVKRIVKWVNPFKKKDSMQLDEIGRNEMIEMGRRFAKRIQGEINIDFKRMAFSSSNRSRSIESAEFFRKGFLEKRNKNKLLIPEIELSDIRLRFFDDCPILRNSVDKNRTALKEYHDFFHSKIFQNALNDINQKLKLPVNSAMQKDELFKIYSFCGIEKGLLNESILCDLIKDHYETLEYLADLKAYWRKSYGHQLSSKVSCILLKDIFDDIITAKQKHSMGDTKFEQLHFQFGHAETILPLIGALGIYKLDIPLTSHNFDIHTNRTFKVSKISPFSTNLGFVLYHCMNKLGSSYKIQLLHKELPIPFPICNGDMFCDLDTVIKHYEEFIINCHRTRMCEYYVKDEL